MPQAIAMSRTARLASSIAAIGASLALLALASCGGGGGGGGGGGSGSGGCADVGGGPFLYALSDSAGAANRIHGFRVNASTGALTALSCFPVDTGGLGDGNSLSERMTYDAANRRLYVVNEGSNTVSAYAVNAGTGALTALPFSPLSIPGAGAEFCMAVHPSGSPLVIGRQSTQDLTSFTITATAAALASGSPFSTGTAAPASCAFSRDGNYVYAGGGNPSSAFAGFSVTAATGVLAPLPGTPFASGVYPGALATDSAGRIFSAGFNNNQARVFTTVAGVPTGGNPIASGLTEAVHGALHPSGYYMVADRVGNRIGVYQIGGSSAAPTLAAVPGSPFASGGLYSNVLALQPNGTFLYAANSNSRNISVIPVTAASGALGSPVVQPANTLGTSGGITGMVVTPN
jgi:6-phosphogluconolactonase